MPHPSNPPTRIDLSTLGNPIYVGSVQHIYAVPDHPGFMVCETTEAGSVFDVGSIFTIEGNDLSRAVFRHALYSRLGKPETWQRVKAAIEKSTTVGDAWKKELLSGPLESMLERGGMTHHIGMIDAKTGEVVADGMPANPSCFNVVWRFPVMKPPQRTFLGGHIFDYAQFHQSESYVIPLEYIVRFGITGGSSVLRKYETLTDAGKKAYEQELGLSGAMQAWQMLDRPIYDLTSKYEPEDRNVTKQEAVMMSGLAASDFLDTIKMAILGGWAVSELLDQIGLTLWDLKWEFAIDREDALFVDTIDTDSFRATSFLERAGKKLVIHYNKQSMRDYYKIIHADWFAGVNEAKKEAKKSGQAFTELLKAGQSSGRWPHTPDVDPGFLKLQSEKTFLIRQHVLGSESAASVRDKLKACGVAEVDFYDKRGLLAKYVEANGV
jgi:phosphoribosylaminoimidazole-succinocarboxamide synthase